MQFKASTDYGMRAILYLAAQGTTCSSVISRRTCPYRGLSHPTGPAAAQRGLIEARLGKHGGYRLVKEPSDITVLQIMKALGGGCEGLHPRQALVAQGRRHGAGREADRQLIEGF